MPFIAVNPKPGTRNPEPRTQNPMVQQCSMRLNPTLENPKPEAELFPLSHEPFQQVGPYRVTRSMGSTVSAVLSTAFKMQVPHTTTPSHHHTTNSPHPPHHHHHTTTSPHHQPTTPTTPPHQHTTPPHHTTTTTTPPFTTPPNHHTTTRPRKT